MDTGGNLYGTTYSGGANRAKPTRGDGVQADASLDQWGKLDRVNPLELWQRHRRRSPEAGLIMDTGGNLYGTTYTAGLTESLRAWTGRCSS